MAYVQCGNCPWEQDDFWTVNGYNPIRYFVRNIVPWMWKPRMIEIDESFAEDLGWKHARRFSWCILASEIRTVLWKFRRQRWWTWNSYERARANGTARCPQCGSPYMVVE